MPDKPWSFMKGILKFSMSLCMQSLVALREQGTNEK